MSKSFLRIILVSTPIGHLGSGYGGGVELTLSSLMQGLLNLGHQVILIAPDGSELPQGCSSGEILHVKGADQPSWQHVEPGAPVVIPCEGVLPRLLDQALELGKSADAVLNFSYDWLPIWLTPHVHSELFHLVSMGGVSKVMRALINDLAKTNPYRLAFHTYRQASDYEIPIDPIVVGNGFDLSKYDFNLSSDGPIGWAGRIAPEKGLEDAVAVASGLRDRLMVWGLMEDPEYAKAVEASVPSGTIEWRGFMTTAQFQEELGQCRAFLNTPKWNEAYGNVVVEALACGVPVVAYDRGGPGELITQGVTGWLVAPNNISEMTSAVRRIDQLDRQKCRNWVESNASQDAFAKRVENWILQGLKSSYSKNSLI